VKEVRARLALAGHPNVGIFVSGGMTVERIRQFVEATTGPLDRNTQALFFAALKAGDYGRALAILVSHQKQVIATEGQGANSAQKLGDAHIEAAQKTALFTHNVVQLKSSIDNLHGKTVQVAVSGIPAALQGLGGVAAALARIQSKNVNINFTTSGRVPGITYGAATGAVFSGASGPLRVGEGSYNTPVGAGGEIVSNRGVLPLSDAVIAKLGKAIGGRSGGSDVHVHFHGGTFVGSSKEQVAHELAPEISKQIQRRRQLMSA